MTTIIINGALDDDLSLVIKDLIERHTARSVLVMSPATGVNVLTVGDLLADKPVDAEEPAVEPAATDEIEIEIDPLTVAVEPEPQPVPAELPPQPEVEPQPAPAQEPEPAVAAFNDRVVIKNLLTGISIPACANESIPFSTLSATNVSSLGDYVTFTYCGIFYKFPVYKGNGSDCVNVNSSEYYQHSNTSIRTILNFENCDITYPCLLDVIEATEGECVVFGADLTHVVNAERNHHSNGEVSTQ